MPYSTWNTTNVSFFLSRYCMRMKEASAMILQYMLYQSDIVLIIILNFYLWHSVKVMRVSFV